MGGLTHGLEKEFEKGKGRMGREEGGVIQDSIFIFWQCRVTQNLTDAAGAHALKRTPPGQPSTPNTAAILNFYKFKSRSINIISFRSKKQIKKTKRKGNNRNMTENDEKSVTCQLCGATIPEDESVQENGQVLCEDCYINLKENQNERKVCKMRKPKSNEKKY